MQASSFTANMLLYVRNNMLSIQLLHMMQCAFHHVEMRALLWSLGNLTLLIGPHNSKIQNNEFFIKVAQLRGRAIMFVSAQEVFTGKHKPGVTFTPDDCKKRGAEMIK